MKLIVGLGNPGEAYANTRHNVGFLCLDRLQKVLSCSPHISKKLKSIYYKVYIPSQGELTAILAKPQTFINESGVAVRKLLDYFRIEFKDLYVIHDDIDLGIGSYKVHHGRGSAGHKGVQSIIDTLGSKIFTRIRIGVGRPVVGIDPERYVLQKFGTGEVVKINKVLEEVIKVIEKKLTQ